MEGNGSERTQMTPFTTSQRQELEQQALIFKCVALGNPIPSDLILSIRKSLLMDSSTKRPQSLTLFPQLSNIGTSVGWGCFQQEFGGKAEDPEPWRCRRTDGKKWRCSKKKAHPDSKYCDNHMHRGKNRSRKLVELSLATNSTSVLISAPQAHHYLCPSSSSLRKTTHSHVDTVLCPLSHNQIHRKLDDFKDNINEFHFFSKLSEHEKDGSWSIRPPGMSSDAIRYIEERNKHCVLLSSELESGKPVKLEREEYFEKPRPFHIFFDEWPQSCRDVEKALEKEELEEELHSETELSIAIPTALHDLQYN
ncbi:growth-regulating factor 1-like [Typha latifolia]|uniref:growth-regulating factor 1-like n=1 Tax=Typha latifolia TaxID=4733 RepID=UPI003C2AADA4